MTYENNEKYIADTWIENGKEEEFKTSFLESLLNQYKGHTDDGSGFDADMVDGMHYYQIQEEFDDKIRDFLPSFKVGLVNVTRENIESKGGDLIFGFDGIKLRPDNEDGYGELYKKLPWESGYVKPDWSELNTGAYPNLLQVFEDLYEKHILTKATKEEFNALAQTVDQFDNNMTFIDDHRFDVKDEETGEILESYLNADSINGVRLYIIGKQEYSELNQDIKDDCHNLFVIKEDESEFDDCLKARQPNTAKISRYYEFRIDVRQEVDELGNIVTKRWLQYKHQDLENWNDLWPTDDFIDPDVIKRAFEDAMSTNSNYVINETAFMNSLKNVTVTDLSNFSLVNYIRKSGAKSAKASCLVDNDTNPNGICPTDPANPNGLDPYYIDLDSFYNKIKEDLTEEIMAAVPDKIYPIGSIYISVLGDNPKDKFPGTKWEKIENCFLYGSGVKSLGSGGGSMLPVLPPHHHTVPAHFHPMAAAESNPASSTFLFSNAKNIYVTSKKYQIGSENKKGYHFVLAEDNAGIGESGTTGYQMDHADRQHPGNGYINYEHTRLKNTSHDGNSGDLSEANMPPYLVVNIWQRIE